MGKSVVDNLVQQLFLVAKSMAKIEGDSDPIFGR